MLTGEPRADVARATLEDAGERLRATRRGTLGDEVPGDLDAALRLVREALGEWGSRVQATRDPPQARAARRRSC